MSRGNIDILLITGGDFGNKAAATNIDKLLKVLLDITNNLYLITYCDKKLISNISKERIHSLTVEGNRFKRFFLGQILVSETILSVYRRDNIQIAMFAFGQDLQILPIILAKMLSKRMVIRSDGRPTMVLKKYLKSGSLLKRCLFKVIEEIDYRLADTVLAECEYMISENNLQKYKARGGNLFVDTNKFIDRKRFHNRRYEIGFIGRLDEAKGILNFLKALEVLNGNPNVIIIGDGEEKNSVLSRIQLLKSTNKLDVRYVDWIENAKLPNYLNEIRVVVVPSYKEGLPNVVLESMACGCIVLATPVGGIPGVIKDEETGFIMENNSPECIATNVIRALSHPRLGEIVHNACSLVEREYTYDKAVERYRNILVNLKKDLKV